MTGEGDIGLRESESAGQTVSLHSLIGQSVLCDDTVLIRVDRILPADTEDGRGESCGSEVCRDARGS